MKREILAALIALPLTFGYAHATEDYEAELRPASQCSAIYKALERFSAITATNLIMAGLSSSNDLAGKIMLENAHQFGDMADFMRNRSTDVALAANKILTRAYDAGLDRYRMEETAKARAIKFDHEISDMLMTVSGSGQVGGLMHIEGALHEEFLRCEVWLDQGALPKDDANDNEESVPDK